MSEIFTIACKNVAVSALQDILSAKAASTKKLELLAVEMNANGQTTVGNYPIRIRYLPATVTAGSGGGSVSGNNVNSDGASASFTARANDTTQSSSSGTAVDIVDTQFNPINGYYWEPPARGEPPKADLNAQFVLSLDANPAATINVSATMWLKES